MKEGDILAIADKLFSESFELLKSKNKDYSTNDDALSGFKLAARDAGVTNYQAWLIFARKHWGAIATFCRNGGQVESEPIEERLKDMINYCILLACLIEDNRKDIVTSAMKDIQSHYEVGVDNSIRPNLDSNPKAFK